MSKVTIVVICAVAVIALTAVASADELNGAGTHTELNTIVTKIASGVIFVEPFEGLRPRTISPAKADRVGLHEAKAGDEVTLVIDEGNVLVDAHKAGMPAHGHRHMTGNLAYTDVSWKEVQLSTPDGIERYDVDALAGSRLSLMPDGTPVVVELDEDNTIIDIHRLAK
jgi:hypothetical protein